MYIRMLKPLKTRKEKEELKLKRPGSTNCRNHSDVMVSGVIVASPDSDAVACRGFMMPEANTSILCPPPFPPPKKKNPIAKIQNRWKFMK